MINKCYSLLDVAVSGGDSFSIINSVATLEKNCLSSTVRFKDSRLDEQPDGFFEITIGKNKFAMNKITTSIADGGVITSTHGTRIIDISSNLSGVSLDNYHKFSKSILGGSGLYILSGSKSSSLKSFAINVSTTLSHKGLSVVRISRLGEKFCYSVNGNNLIVNSISTLKELIVLYKYDVVLIDATATSDLIDMAIYLGELGFTCVVEMSNRSGCHAIEAMNRTFGAKRFSSIIKAILFVGAVPALRKSDFKRIQFKDDDRYGFWERIPHAPNQAEYVLQCEDFKYAKKMCVGKVFLCELIEIDADVANEVIKDRTARDYITTFSLSPTWRSVYSLGVRVVKDSETTVDFLDFFVGRY